MTIEEMKEDLKNVQYHKIKLTDYKEFFVEYQFNGKSINEIERRGIINMFNEVMEQYLSGMPLIFESLEMYKDRQDAFGEINRIVSSSFLFTITTMLDYHVAGKYFLLADDDYDKRFMRGKMHVILNEGFKKLYGFDAKTKPKSEWTKLKSIMPAFHPIIQQQYDQLSSLLDVLSTSSNWWRDQRNFETHLDVEHLYESRQKELREGEVMMESLKLYNALLAVNQFLTNVNACITNYLIDKYNKGELAEE